MPVFKPLFITLALSLIPAIAHSVPDALLPIPAKIEYQRGHWPLPDKLSHSFSASVSPKLSAALQRFSEQIAANHGRQIQLAGSFGRPLLDFKLDHAGAEYPQPNTDESYRLQVNANGVSISAASVYGAMKALQTLRQLIVADIDGSLKIPFVQIYDTPRFRWRGMLVDTSRHFMPIPALRRMLDAMEMVKLNVLHLHLSDDQGFRVESLALPELHRQGSNGEYYSRAEIKALVSYAAARGIRVVPEFGLPGHSTSWQIGYPQLAATPQPPKKTGVSDGIFSNPIDPTKPSTYKLIEALIGDMAPLFPDPYWHIGGDEVNDTAWTGNAAIQAWMADNQIADSRALQAYFTGRYVALLKDYGKSAIGWQEILHPDIPADPVVQLWTGREFPASLAGRDVLTSLNYYLDHQQPAWHMYGFDPTDFVVADIDEASRDAIDQRLLGAELANWAETVNGNTLDLRTWPRSAAIAERFWSPRTTVAKVSKDDLYRRLDIVSARMQAAGIQHIAQSQAAIKRLAGKGDVVALNTLAAVLEPAGMHFVRGREALTGIARAFFLGGNVALPDGDNLVESLPAESVKAREFGKLVNRYIAGNKELSFAIELQLHEWANNHGRLASTISRSTRLNEADINAVSQGLKEIAGIGIVAMRFLVDQQKPGLLERWRLREQLDDYDYAVIDLNSTAGMLGLAADLMKSNALSHHNIAIQPAVSRLLEAAINQ